MDTHITILIARTVIINLIHTFIIPIILTHMGDFCCMGTAIGMVITRIMEDGAGTTEGGTVITEIGMRVMKAVGKVDIKVVGKVGIKETGEELADIMVDLAEDMVDERYVNQKRLTRASKRA
jgi:hypothetical protein